MSKALYGVRVKRFSFQDWKVKDLTVTGDLIATSPTIQGTVLAGTGLTMPAFTLGGTVTATGQEIDAAILDACVAKGTWTASGTWTIPAVTLNGVVSGVSTTNYFDAGASSMQVNTTGLNVGLVVQSTQDGAYGANITAKHISASPLANDVLLLVNIVGKDSAANDEEYCQWRCVIEDPTSTSEAGKQEWHNLLAGADNTAMTLSGAGGLAVDLDNGGTDYYVALFDDYDDALVLRQGIQQNNRELLADIGILERKNTGSGYMMKVQPMVRLLAGGIYQSRAMIDSLQEKVAQLESKLMLLEVGNG